MKTCPIHPNRKVKHKGLCGSCYDKKLKKENPKYRLAQIKNTTNWHKLHPQARSEYNAKRRARDLQVKDKPEYKILRRGRMVWKEYRLFLAELSSLVAKQKSKCAICRRTLKKYHIDHCHQSNKIRGLLCHQCNWYLGLIDADPKILNRISKYRQAIDPLIVKINLARYVNFEGRLEKFKLWAAQLSKVVYG